jgi:xylulose-5-phosphate/fructose-6-phosphate phosphoketolase
MTVLNDPDRFHLVQDMINRLLQLGAKATRLMKIVRARLIEHKQYIYKNGVDMPEIVNWKRSDSK